MEGKVGTGFDFENGGVGFKNSERMPFVGHDFGDEFSAFAGENMGFPHAPVVVVDFQFECSCKHDESFFFRRVQMPMNRHERSRLERVHELVDVFVHRFVEIVVHAQTRACLGLCVNVVEDLL